MMEISNDIVEKYKELSKRFNELYLEEERLEGEHAELLDEYNSSKKAFNDTCDIYTKIKNRFDDRKRKFISKKHSKHINLVMLITLVISLSCVGIYSSFGFVANKLTLYCGPAMLALLAGLIDINFLWDKLSEKYSSMFDELDSTKSTRETLDKIYVQKLRNEKEMNDAYDKVSSHAKITIPVTSEKNIVQKEINDLKIKFFEDMFKSEKNISDDIQLTLK